MPDSIQHYPQVNNNQALALNADNYRTFLETYIDHISPMLDNNPSERSANQQDLRSAIISSLCVLRQVNKSSQHEIDSKIKKPVLSVVGDAQLSFDHFHNGPGVAMQRLFRALNPQDKNNFKQIVSNTSNKVFNDLFDSSRFSNINKSSNVEPCYTDFSFDGLNGNQRSIVQEGKRVLSYFNLTNGSLAGVDYDVKLLGKIDLNSRVPFEGAVLLSSRQINPETKLIVTVMDKNLSINNSFNCEFLISGSEGVRIQTYPDGTKIEWQCTFGENGMVQPGSKGVRIDSLPDGRKIEWQCTFGEGGMVQPGSKGVRIDSLPDGRKIERQCTFGENGMVQPGSKGVIIKTLPDGEKIEWQCTFDENERAQPGSKGVIIKTLPDGRKIEWQCTLGEGGMVQPGSKGVIIKRLPDGSKLEWQCTFDENERPQPGSEGVIIKTLPDGSKLEWQCTLGEGGMVQPGSKGVRIDSLPDGRKIERQCTFGENGMVQPGSKGVIIKTLPDGRKIERQCTFGENGMVQQSSEGKHLGKRKR